MSVITPRQAAAKIGVSTHAVYRWLRSGILRGYRVGGRYWISAADLSAVVQVARER